MVEPTTEQGIQPVPTEPPAQPPEDLSGLKSTLEKLKAENAQYREATRKLAEQFGQATGNTSLLEQLNQMSLTQAFEEKLATAQAQARQQTEAELRQQYSAQLQERERKLAELQAQATERARLDSLAVHFTNPDYCQGNAALLPQWKAVAELNGFSFEFGEDGAVRQISQGGQPLLVEESDDGIGGKRAGELVDPLVFAWRCRSGKYGPVLQSLFPPLNTASGVGTPSPTAAVGGVQVWPSLTAFNEAVAKAGPAKAREMQQQLMAGKIRFKE